MEPSPDLSCYLLPPREGTEPRGGGGAGRELVLTGGRTYLPPLLLLIYCYSAAAAETAHSAGSLLTPPIICSSHSTAMKLSQYVAFVPRKDKEDQRNLTSIKHYLDEELDSGPTRKLSN